MRALEFPSPLTLREARAALLAECSASTTNRYLAAARACVNFARATGLLPPTALWPPRLMLREPTHRERFLADEELAEVLKAARAHSTLMHAAVMFAVGVGCRQSEQLRVRWGDIDASSATVAIRVTKSDTSRRAHLPPAALAALKELHGRNVLPMRSRFVFAEEDGAALKTHILISRWQKVREAAGVPDVRWHDLRHSCASYLIQHGSSLSEIGAQLGHKNVATSKRYAHLIPGAKPTGADELNSKLSGKS
jgi:integrase